MKRGVSMEKIRVVTLCFVLLFGFASFTHAELPASRIALGVQLGAKFEDAKNVFGVPERVTMEEVKSEAYGDFVESTFIYEKESIVSKSKNTPFIGKKLKGLVQYTIVGGEIKYSAK